MPALEGVIVALLTPVDREGKVDHGALRQLVERLTSRGVAGVSPLGSTGEGYSLGLDQRLAVVDTVAESVTAGMPVIPGVFAHNHEQAVAEIAAYAGHGATAVLAAPPAYYPLTPAEQQGYFGRLADATALPLVIYNIPVFTKIVIDPAAVGSGVRYQVAGDRLGTMPVAFFKAVEDTVREIVNDLFHAKGIGDMHEKANRRRPRWHRLPYGVPLCIGFLGYLFLSGIFLF